MSIFNLSGSFVLNLMLINPIIPYFFVPNGSRVFMRLSSKYFTFSRKYFELSFIFFALTISGIEQYKIGYRAIQKMTI
jgi:hypothetical protein